MEMARASFARTVLLTAVAWVAVISGLHLWVNQKYRYFAAEPAGRAPLRVGFLPVTCHLTCPVNHFIQENLSGDGGFEPMRFNGWPELKESFLSGHTDATFLLAPMAMRLREEGVPIKIVYLGHRDGTAIMVHSDSDIRRFRDLRGKTIAVPNRFSNQRLLIFKLLHDRGMTIDDVNLVEMAPPDMPAALYAKAVDAVTSGEPFMAQTELDGYGRVLCLTRDAWPNFISCVLAVHEDVIETDRPRVQALVDGIARSGVWLDRGLDRRMQAAQFVSRHYYHQDPRLLEFVLAKPPDRVKYTNLNVRRPDFEEIALLAKEAGILEGTASFDDYTDTTFVNEESTIEDWPYHDEAAMAEARERGAIP